MNNVDESLKAFRELNKLENVNNTSNENQIFENEIIEERKQMNK